MLELIDVKKSYPVYGRQTGQRVLEGINLKVQAGQRIVIAGPSGCGKSTLLNLIGGLDKADSGQVLFEGCDLGKASDAEISRIRNARIGFVFQMHHLLPQLTVMENVLLPTIAGSKREDKTDKATELLDRVGLKQWCRHRPGQLSGGQRQRAAVVRAMINEPVLLLADEPTGALDKEASENIAELLVELNEKDGVGLIVVTHSTELADRIGNVMRLDNGILSSGETAE